MTVPDSIMVNERIAANLATRRAADELFDFVNSMPTKTVVLNFKSVAFASRSFTHEYLMLKSDTKKKIVEKNMAVPIKKMFMLVSKESPRTHYVASTSFRAMPLSAKSL